MPSSNQKYLYLSHNFGQNLDQTPIVLQTTNNMANMADSEETNGFYGAFNLGLHVKDDPQDVHQHRATLLADIQSHYPHITHINWLSQVHGDTVVIVKNLLPQAVMPADAQITNQKNIALAIMTADCVPIMLSNADGTLIGAVHAGWQGLAKGIIGKTVTKMREQILPAHAKDPNANDNNTDLKEWQAWVGASIAVTAYEVDERVREQVLAGMRIADNALSTTLFIPVPNKAGHYMANLPAITEYQLHQAGVTAVVQSGLDSHSDPRFYSYRQQTQQRQPFTGRMATVIFMGQ